jgi:uncharacterized membrane protein YebE (DUF533 family)
VNEKKKPKYAKFIEIADKSSLGISIVVAIALGAALGVWLKNISGWAWMLPLGIAWGVGAAIYNVYKAYKKQKKELDELKNEPRYKYKHTNDDEDDDKY